MTVVRALAASFCFLAVPACVEPEEGDDLDLADTEQAVQGGYQAADWQSERAAKINRCTATQIGIRHAITAIHCNPKVGSWIQFYGTSVYPRDSDTMITDISIPPGTAIYADGGEDWSDSEGRLADFAILEFSPPQYNTYAHLAWRYPGDDRLGIVVGAGDHNGEENETDRLFQQTAETYSDDDDSGGFYTNVWVGDKGDSGGAFYVGAQQLLGVTHGAHWIFVWRGRFTSVPEHLAFILGAINWNWMGDPPEQKMRVGSILSIFSNTHKVCQYACWETSGCVAYNWSTALGQCTLLGSVTGSVTSSAYRSALR
jgi:hypothetical protein